MFQFTRACRRLATTELDKLKYISNRLDAISGSIQRKSESSADFGLFIIIVLLALILWRVW